MMNRIRNCYRALGNLCRDTSPFVWGCLILTLLTALWTQSLPADSELARHLASEEGLFEQASAGFLIAAALMAMVSAAVLRSGTWLAAGTVFAYAALRELDFQKMFTYRSIMSLGYYTRDVAPLSEKLLVILLITPCLLAIVYLLHRARKDAWLRGPAAGPQRAWVFWIAVLFLLSHITDRHSEWVGFLPGRIGTLEALVETALALALLMMMVELKPRFPRERGGTVPRNAEAEPG